MKDIENTVISKQNIDTKHKLLYYKFKRTERGMRMDELFFKQVGNNILRILNKQGKTQQYLANQLGISKQVMSKIISGAKAINVAEITQIANCLSVSTDCLLTEDVLKTPAHNFSFMGDVKNEKTRKKIEFLKTVIDEIVFLEEYADESKDAE